MSCNFILNFLPLVQGSVNYAPQTKSNMWLVFVKKKVLLETATLISLHSIYSCVLE